LIRQWVAEGFVHHSPGQNLEDVAQSYFSELINRGLIQPANTNYGEVVSCRVHDVILDFILSSCTEANFVSVAYNLGEIRGQNEYKIRRLLLDPRIGDEGDTAIAGTTATTLSHVRSLQLFGEPLPVLLLSKYLRVLTLENQRVDLTTVGQLFQLRYLNVSAGAIELPTEIQGLQHLAIFQIFCTSEIRLPSETARLPRLRHLILPLYTRLLDGIGRMKSLCTLEGFDVSDVQNINDLGVLINLRDLQLYNSQVLTEIEIDALVTSLGKLCNLRSLCIICSVGQWTHDVNDRLGSLSCPPFHQIQKLELIRWLLPRAPRWINGGLQSLIRLKLSVKETSTAEVRVLGALPSRRSSYCFWPRGIPSSGAPEDLLRRGFLLTPALRGGGHAKSSKAHSVIHGL
jgi:hypothetical protein